MSTHTIGLIIPTYNAESTIDSLIGKIEAFQNPPKILVIDSSSTDSTVENLRRHAIDVIVIAKSDFNHGATREFARKQLNTDLVVFLTQDAVPVNSNLVENLIAPLLENDDIAVSYGRQMAHDGADILEKFPREYNYGAKPQIRSLKDVCEYGVYTFFCAAYKNAALDEIGGFKAVLTNEDYFAVAGLLLKGYKIAYVPDAIVKHSHRYSLWQEFQRYFDTGYARAETPVIQQLVGQAEARGIGYVSALLMKLGRQRPILIPYALTQSLMKWLGYRAGFYGKYFPLWLVKRLSQQSYYWSSKYYVSPAYRSKRRQR